MLANKSTRHIWQAQMKNIEGYLECGVLRKLTASDRGHPASLYYHLKEQFSLCIKPVQPRTMPG